MIIPSEWQVEANPKVAYQKWSYNWHFDLYVQYV